MRDGRAGDPGPMIVRPVAGGVEVLAPAKLNLFLEILGRRPDGYHEIESLMVAVDLYDTLDDSPTTRRGRSPCGVTTRRCRRGRTTWSSRRPNGSRRRRGCPRGAHRSSCTRPSPRKRGWPAVRATRRRRSWPWIGSGTCGRPPTGSTRWPGRSAAMWRSSCHAPAAVCRGRGERVEPIAADRRRLHFVLVCPPVGLSTADVYRNLTPPDRPRPIGPVLEALAADGPDALGRSLFNRLQPTAERLAPPWCGSRDALASLRPVARTGT